MANSESQQENRSNNESDDPFDQILEEKANAFIELWENPPRQTAELEDFEFLATIGQGSFGRVVLVQHLDNGEYYALKALKKTKVMGTNQAENTINERNILACTDYPFILHLCYSFKDNSYLYLVTEFVIGGEMYNLLKKMKKLPESFVQFYTAQVFLAFEYLHYIDIIYRDLKPENLLICHDGYLVVADFGFAKVMSKEKRTWTVCGTPDYMAPEIITNKGYGHSADWWSFGILLYEMTAGYAPFVDSDIMKTFGKIMKGKFKCLNSFSRNLMSLIRGLLQVDLSRRMGNLKDGLKCIKNHAFYSEYDWIDIYNKRIKPPRTPKVKNEKDLGNFDHFNEEPWNISSTCLYEREFADF